MSATRKLSGALGIAAGVAILAFALAGAGSAFGQVGTPSAGTTGTSSAGTGTTTSGTPTSATTSTTPSGVSTPGTSGTSITTLGTPTTTGGVGGQSTLPSTGTGSDAGGMNYWLIGLGAAAALLGAGALVTGTRRKQ